MNPGQDPRLVFGVTSIRYGASTCILLARAGVDLPPTLTGPDVLWSLPYTWSPNEVADAARIRERFRRISARAWSVGRWLGSTALQAPGGPSGAAPLTQVVFREVILPNPVQAHKRWTVVGRAAPPMRQVDPVWVDIAAVNMWKVDAATRAFLDVYAQNGAPGPSGPRSPSRASS